MAEPIRPKDLAAAPSVPADAAIIMDNGSLVLKATPAQIADTARPYADQSQAEGGSNNATTMTPLRTKQAIDSQIIGKANAAAMGVPGSDDDLGEFEGDNIPDGSTAKAALQALSDALDTTSGDAATKTNATAIGIAATDANMGTTPGTILSDNGTAKDWFEESEAAIEDRPTSAVLAADDGSTLIGIKGPLPDEVATSAYLNLIEVKRVIRWGAEPGNTAAANRTALQKAIDSSSRAELVFPDGDMEINDLLTIPNGSIAYLVGQGCGVSRLLQNDMAKGAIKFDMNYAQGGGVRGLTIAADVAAGAQGSSGIGLQVVNANDQFMARDFEVVSFDKCLRVDGSFQPSFKDFRLLYFGNYGIFLSPYTGAGTDTAGTRWQNGKISNFGYLGANPELSDGILIHQGSGEYFDTIDITQVGIPIHVAPPSGSFARFLKFKTILADTSYYEGWMIDGTNAPTLNIRMVDCWVSGAGGGALRPAGSVRGSGLLTKGVNLDDVTWIGGEMRDNDCGGWRHEGGSNIRVSGASISRNSRRIGFNNQYPGVAIVSGVSDWSLQDCRIGNFSEGVFAVDQAEAVVIEVGASDRFQIIGNDLSNPGAGKVAISNGSTQNDCIIKDNLPNEFTTVGDFGVTLQAIFTRARDGDKITIPPGSYTMTTGVSTDKELHIDATGATFTVAANVVPFSFVASYSEIKALSANYAPGATSISVSALTAALAAGQPFKIISNAVDPADRDSGSNAQQYRTGEWAHAAGGTTTSITLQEPLRFSQGISPTSTVGDEAFIDAYTTAMTARVAIPTGRTFSWCGGTIEFEAGHSGSGGWNSAAMLVSGYLSPRIIGLKVTQGYYHGISLLGNYRPLVEGCDIGNLEDDTANGKLGYGVADTSFATIVRGCIFRTCRHGYTSSAATISAGFTNSQQVFSVGRTVGALIEGCVGIGGVNAPFDTHHSSEDATFRNCETFGAASYALQLRGRNLRVEGFKARSCGLGINVFTEYQSGDTDDDLFTSGKPQGQTTATLSNLDIESDGAPLTFSNARNVTLDGVNRLSAAGNEWIINSGSQVTLDGVFSFETSSLDGQRPLVPVNSTSIIRVSPIAAQLASAADYLARVTVAEGATVKVNVTGATGTGLTAITLDDSTCSFVNNGNTSIDLSPTFTTLLSGTAANFTGSASGQLFWSVASAADNSITLGLVGTNLNASALDLTARWAGSTLEPIKVYRNSNVNVTHTGTGAENASVYTPPLIADTSLNENGHYQCHEMRLTKSGAVGTATINGRMGGSFNWTHVMAATDTGLSVVLHIWTRGASSQYCWIESKSSDSAGAVTSNKQVGISRTVNLGSNGQINRLGVTAAIGDTVAVATYSVTADKAGFST